jgi:hypothetical protein
VPGLLRSIDEALGRAPVTGVNGTLALAGPAPTTATPTTLAPRSRATTTTSSTTSTTQNTQPPGPGPIVTIPTIPGGLPLPGSASGQANQAITDLNNRLPHG